MKLFSNPTGGRLSSLMLGILFLQVTRGLRPPVSAVVQSLDLDFKLTWEPPSDASGNLTIAYTVVYAEQTSIYLEESKWVQVPTCVNVTSSSCNISIVIDILRDFTTKIVFRITAEENGVKSNPLQVDFFPDRHLYFRPPLVHVTTVTYTLIGLQLFGPQSPYIDPEVHGKLLRVEEVAPSLKDRIHYHVTFVGAGRREIKNATAAYPYIEFTNLEPGSDYNLSAMTTYYGVFEHTSSKQATTKALFTLLNAKVHMPLDVELKEETIVNCSHPNLRNIVVTWKRPVVSQPIRFYDLKFWNSGREAKATSYVIRSEVNRSEYSFIIYDLPRWSQTEVMIYANTTATGCASFKSALFPHAVDDEHSRPENLSFTKSESNTWTIYWNAPHACTECIVGYEVSWKLSNKEYTANSTRDIVPPDEFHYVVNKHNAEEVTLVAVTSLLMSGASMQKAGQQAVLGIHYEETQTIFKTITICLVVVVAIMALLLGLFCRAKSKKRKWKENVSIVDILSSKKGNSEVNIFRPPTTTSSGPEYNRYIYVREPEVFDELLPPAPLDEDQNHLLPNQDIDEYKEPTIPPVARPK